VALYLHSPIRFLGVVLGHEKQGDNFEFTFTLRSSVPEKSKLAFSSIRRSIYFFIHLRNIYFASLLFTCSFIYYDYSTFLILRMRKQVFFKGRGFDII
jgi:hypothetical protein